MGSNKLRTLSPEIGENLRINQTKAIIIVNEEAMI